MKKGKEFFVVCLFLLFLRVFGWGLDVVPWGEVELFSQSVGVGAAVTVRTNVYQWSGFSFLSNIDGGVSIGGEGGVVTLFGNGWNMYTFSGGFHGVAAFVVPWMKTVSGGIFVSPGFYFSLQPQL